MTNMATLGGHVTLSDYVIVGGLAAVHQNCRVGRYAFIGGGAMAVLRRDPLRHGLGQPCPPRRSQSRGLKRRGFSREEIHTLRAAFRAIFSGAGRLDERVSQVADAYAGWPQVMEIVAFIRADASRPLCLPRDEA